MNRTRRTLLATCATITITVPMGGSLALAAPDNGITTTDTTITVVSGDSLVGVAHRYEVSVRTLMRVNSLTLVSVIHPGDSLVIPAGATVAPARPAASTSKPAPGAVATGSYEVRVGDALAGIAWRHGVTLTALLQANSLEATSLILPGRRLDIPPATRAIPEAPAPVAAATTVERPTGTATAAPSAAPQGSSLDTVLTYARAQVGTPYRFFSAGPDAFDCSGLVVAAFRQAGVSLPHQSRALAQRGTAVDWVTTAIQPGDLVFTSSFGDPAQITHVGIALSSRTWIQAVGGERPVSITMLPSDAKIMAVRRLPLP